MKKKSVRQKKKKQQPKINPKQNKKHALTQKTNMEIVLC